MKISPSGYIRNEHIEPDHYIDSLNGFDLYIIHGIENFNLKEVYKAVVRSAGSTHTGNHWSTLDEAVSEGRGMLIKVDSDWKVEFERLRKLYGVE